MGATGVPIMVQFGPRLRIIFYRSGSGREPVREWLRKLDKYSRGIVGNDVRTIEFGWPVSMPLATILLEVPMNNKHVGSDFDDFLEQEGLLESTRAVAIKRVLAMQIEDAMKAGKLSKGAMARAMGTSRSAVDRLLNSDSPSVTLLTLEKAARALGKTLTIELRP